MKLKFVYGILPAFVFYVDSLDGFGGKANGPVVRVLKKYSGSDEGLLQHELTHVKQWYRTFFTHGFWYMFVENYRLDAEIEAYKVQAKYYDYDATVWMAEALATKYNITSYTKAQIRSMLNN